LSLQIKAIHPFFPETSREIVSLEKQKPPLATFWQKAVSGKKDLFPKPTAKKIMKPFLLFCAYTILLNMFFCCTRSSVAPKDSTEYLPLQVGNYWKVSNTDYLEITGTKVLSGREYFEITSQNQWGTRQLYVRVDEKLNVIQAYSNTTHTRTIANLGLPKGGQVKDDFEEPTVIDRTSDKIVFRYQCMPCSQANATYEVAFHKGKGLLSRNLLFGGTVSGNPAFKEIRINGIVYPL